MRVSKHGCDGELEEAAGANHALGFAAGGTQVRDVHEAHGGGGEIEGGVGKRKRLCAGDGVPNAATRRDGVPNERG